MMFSLPSPALSIHKAMRRERAMRTRERKLLIILQNHLGVRGVPELANLQLAAS